MFLPLYAVHLCLCLIPICTHAQLYVFEEAEFSPATVDFIRLSGDACGHFGLQDYAPSFGTAGTSQEVETQASGVNETVHWNSSLNVDPSTFTLKSYDFSIHYSNIVTRSQGMGYAPAIIQGGKAFYPNISTSSKVGTTGTRSGWNYSYRDKITPGDFTRCYDLETEEFETANPDFSASGGLITFGFLSWNVQGIGIRVNFDDIRIMAISTDAEPRIRRLDESLGDDWNSQVARGSQTVDFVAGQVRPGTNSGYHIFNRSSPDTEALHLFPNQSFPASLIFSNVSFSVDYENFYTGLNGVGFRLAIVQGTNFFPSVTPFVTGSSLDPGKLEGTLPVADFSGLVQLADFAADAPNFKIGFITFNSAASRRHVVFDNFSTTILADDTSYALPNNLSLTVTNGQVGIETPIIHSNLTYEIEQSTDLANWTTLTNSVLTSQGLQVMLPASQQKNFFRFKASR